MIHAVYALWLARNEIKEGKRVDEPHAIIERVCDFMQEWREAHNKTGLEPKVPIMQRWSAPEEGWIKANTDDAMSKFGGKSGGGVVLRDHNGAFLAGASHFFPHVVDAKAAEIKACKRALLLAAERNVQRIQLELDSQALVQMINTPERTLATTGSWVEEIKTLLRSFDAFSVSWVRRSANIAAHKLAKIGVGEELCKVWLGSPPDCILEVIAGEIPDSF